MSAARRDQTTRSPKHPLSTAPRGLQATHADLLPRQRLEHRVLGHAMDDEKRNFLPTQLLLNKVLLVEQVCAIVSRLFLDLVRCKQRSRQTSQDLPLVSRTSAWARHCSSCPLGIPTKISPSILSPRQSTIASALSPDPLRKLTLVQSSFSMITPHTGTRFLYATNRSNANSLSASLPH